MHQFSLFLIHVCAYLGVYKTKFYCFLHGLYHTKSGKVSNYQN